MIRYRRDKIVLLCGIQHPGLARGRYFRIKRRIVYFIICADGNGNRVYIYYAILPVIWNSIAATRLGALSYWFAKPPPNPAAAAA